MRIFIQIGLISVLFFSGGATFAQTLDLPSIISEGMVLQAGKPVPVWGRSAAGETVQVWFKGKHRRTRANSDGDWKVQFPSSESGGPYEIKVVAAGKQKIISDVYVGDVWLVSGEGHRLLGGPADSANQDSREETQAANVGEGGESIIRFFKVEQNFSAVPEFDTGDEIWRTPLDSDATISTLSRLLADENYQKREVPVGIIEALWEDTPAQAWVDPRDQSHLDEYAEQASRLINDPHTWHTRFQKHRHNLKVRREIMADTEEFLSIGIHRDDYDAMAWPEITVPFDETWTGIVWLRKHFEWRGASVEPAELSLNGLNDIAWVFVNGQSLGKLNAVNERVIIPAGLLERGTNSLTLRLINADSGVVQFGRHGTAVISSADSSAVLDGSWKYNDVIEGPLPRILQAPQRMAGVLYNGMIHPVSGYPIAGVLWHQGESNLEQASSYELLLKTLIYSWRLKWNELKLPFIVIQLPPANPLAESPAGALAALRSAQQNALTLPYTSLAATLDLPGQPYGPEELNVLTDRIWKLAETLALGERGPLATGPILKKSHRKNTRIVLKFDAAANGLMLGKNGETEFHQSGLELLSNDDVIEPRHVVVEADSITLDIGDVDDPVTVRYAWADNPKAAIYNSEGLPAFPFEVYLK